jgi:hypothetical protein
MREKADATRAGLWHGKGDVKLTNVLCIRSSHCYCSCKPCDCRYMVVYVSTYFSVVVESPMWVEHDVNARIPGINIVENPTYYFIVLLVLTNYGF